LQSNCCLFGLNSGQFGAIQLTFFLFFVRHLDPIAIGFISGAFLTLKMLIPKFLDSMTVLINDMYWNLNLNRAQFKITYTEHMRNFKNKCNLCIQNKTMRKLFAVLSTIITLFAIKETVYIFTSTEPDMVKQKAIMIVIALSISIPLIILSLWLWSPGRKKNDQQN